MKGAAWKRVWKLLLPLGVWIAVWALCALRVGHALLLPGPLAVLGRLVELVGTAPFWQATAATVGRMFLGGALGALLGCAVAALSAWRAPVEWVLTPVMKVVRATPVASFIILVWLWAETTWVPVIISALMAAPVVWGATAQAISGTDPKLLGMACAYRFGGWKTVRLVYIPSVRPAVAAGCRTAMGLAWKSGVAAEVLCRPRWAMGSALYSAKFALETTDVFAWTAAVVILSFLVEEGLGWLLERGLRRGSA